MFPIDKPLSDFETLKESGEILYYKPLYKYEHSGVAFSTEPFSCRWDSGQIGWIAITKESQKLTGILEKCFDDVIKSELKTYEEWVNGECYGYVIPELDDSCWGYIGDYDFCIEDAKDIIDYKIKHLQKRRLQKLKTLIKYNVPLNKRENILYKICDYCSI